MKGLISINEYPIRSVLNTLLMDHSTKQNIVFATDSYVSFGDRYQADSHIDVSLLLGMDAWQIQPRVLKDTQEQSDRTKSKAEVMTPSWLVNKMNNHCDDDWFGRDSVFNQESENNTWETNMNPIEFPEGKSWKDYIESMRLEITCGEAPYLVSRYDTTTGETISVKERIGILDRKLRVVGENTDNKKDWYKWVRKAYESTYGFEYQGDNLLIARINLLITFVDYMKDKWNEEPEDKELLKIANIISWNLWQMDGITGMVPYSSQEVSVQRQLSLFDFISGDEEELIEQAPVPAIIYDWKKKKDITYNSLKEN